MSHLHCDVMTICIASLKHLVAEVASEILQEYDSHITDDVYTSRVTELYQLPVATLIQRCRQFVHHPHLIAEMDAWCELMSENTELKHTCCVEFIILEMIVCAHKLNVSSS